MFGAPEAPHRTLVSVIPPPCETEGAAQDTATTVRLSKLLSRNQYFDVFICFLHHLQGLWMHRIQFQGLIELDQGVRVSVTSEIVKTLFVPFLRGHEVARFKGRKSECDADAVCHAEVPLSCKGIIN